MTNKILSITLFLAVFSLMIPFYGANQSFAEENMIGKLDVSMSPPIMGSVDAPITIVEFGDYQCPKCEKWFKNEKPKIKSDYIDTNKVKLFFVDFPFLGNDSDLAANATYCANDQGKFWEYHSELYSNQGGIGSGWANAENLKQFAIDLNLNIDEFNECLDSNQHADRVSYNKNIGASNGVEGTPVFFIVGLDGKTERINGPQPSSIFTEVIDLMLVEAMAQEMESTTEETAEATGEMMEETAEATEEIAETAMETADDTSETTVEMAEDAGEMAEDVVIKDEGGGCLIATAAYGTEMAPQVQFLREIRDNTVMTTQSGAAFMTGFNNLYYSFSPTIADMERENPVFQEAVRLFITPMISTLSIMTLADQGSESEVLGLGISVIALNLGMYFAAPATVGFTLSKHLKSKRQ